MAPFGEDPHGRHGAGEDRDPAPAGDAPGDETVRDAHGAPLMDVVIEVPRGGLLKRGSTGELDFVSPFPCPFNYGSVPRYVGGDGDLLDALVLGPRLEPGTRARVAARGAVGFLDRGVYDDKLVCSALPLEPSQRTAILQFFVFYALCKKVLNLLRGRTGPTRSEGWREADEAIRRAARHDPRTWSGPRVPF